VYNYKIRKAERITKQINGFVLHCYDIQVRTAHPEGSITPHLTTMQHVVSDKFITEYRNVFLSIRQKFLSVLYHPVTFTYRDILCVQI
jgi:aromatic ring-cleaving dioxygenase